MVIECTAKQQILIIKSMLDSGLCPTKDMRVPHDCKLCGNYGAKGCGCVDCWKQEAEWVIE